jgi:hypothetical protein
MERSTPLRPSVTPAAAPRRAGGGAPRVGARAGRTAEVRLLPCALTGLTSAAAGAILVLALVEPAIEANVRTSMAPDIRAMFAAGCAADPADRVAREAEAEQRWQEVAGRHRAPRG